MPNSCTILCASVCNSMSSIINYPILKCIIPMLFIFVNPDYIYTFCIQKLTLSHIWYILHLWLQPLEVINLLRNGNDGHKWNNKLIRCRYYNINISLLYTLLLKMSIWNIKMDFKLIFAVGSTTVTSDLVKLWLKYVNGLVLVPLV